MPRFEDREIESHFLLDIGAAFRWVIDMRLNRNATLQLRAESIGVADFGRAMDVVPLNLELESRDV
ncbi:MAG: hypothetical protein AAGB46_19870 [Verrucomicrobiota bacterium]